MILYVYTVFVVSNFMPRRSDMELAFRAAIVHERSGRRSVRTSDFVRELEKVNWHLSNAEANQWIARYSRCFRDASTDHSDDKTWLMFNPNGRFIDCSRAAWPITSPDFFAEITG